MSVHWHVYTDVLGCAEARCRRASGLQLKLPEALNAAIRILFSDVL